MKIVPLISALLLLSCAAPKRAKLDTDYEFSYSWKRAAAGAGLAALSGACYGVHETVVHHPSRIPPSWDKQWWDSRVSWTNKGTNLWGSTFGSFGSDAKHTFGPIHRWTLYGAAVVLTIGERRPPWSYLADVGISFVAFSLGFHGTYTYGFRE